MKIWYDIFIMQGGYMRDSTKNLIRKYALMRLKFDFMGYDFDEISELSFHHILIPRNVSPSFGLERGYVECNGVILKKSESHEYLHVIEKYDFDRFCDLTSEMLDEKIKGYLALENLEAIDDILEGFERDFAGVYFEGSKREIIKPSYTNRILQYKKTISIPKK